MTHEAMTRRSGLMTNEGAPPKVGNDRGNDSKWWLAGEMTECRLGNHAVTGGGEAFVMWICGTTVRSRGV